LKFSEKSRTSQFASPKCHVLRYNKVISLVVNNLLNSRQVFARQSIKIVGRNEIVINVFGMSKFEKRFQLLLAFVQSSKKRLPDKLNFKRLAFDYFVEQYSTNDRTSHTKVNF